MRFYLAASFTRKTEIGSVARRLRDIGHKVVSTWHDRNSYDVAPSDNVGHAAAIADMCEREIGECETLVQFTDGEPHRGGRDAELGFARGTRKAILIVGPREHVFHACRAEATVEHFIRWAGCVL